MDQFTLNTYTITVTIPEKPHPKEGFPVLYVLDGAITERLCERLSRAK